MTHFNEAAKNWDSQEKLERAKFFAKAIIKQTAFNGPISIMDIGCGTGLLSYQLTKNAKEILGIDTSSGMLAVFEEKAKDFPGAHSINIDLEKEELKIESKFDLIVSSMAFHHLNEPALLLKKLKPLLSANGKIAIIDLDKEDGSFHADPKNQGVKHFGFSEQDSKKWAEESRLKLNNREIIYEIEKHGKKFPMFLAIFN